jgi:deoxyribonucleoside regulator
MNDQGLLSEVARLYYEQNMTQEEIAKRLYISRSGISRLIKQARDEGVVEITIHYPYDRMRTLEYEFFNRFHIEEIRIVDTGDRPNPADFTAVTKLAASYINSLLSNDSVLGLTWGRSVCGAVHELRPSRYLPKMQVVQMTGSIESNDPIIDGPDLVRFVAEIYGCKYHYLMVPFSVENNIVRDSLAKRSSVIETLSFAEHANIMCTGIVSNTHWGKYMKPEELAEIEAAGAIGYIAGYYFDIHGRIIELPQFYDRIICVGKRIFTEVAYRIAVVADVVKAMATLGALRGGLINSLVTSSKTAAKIIELDDTNK